MQEIFDGGIRNIETAYLYDAIWATAVSFAAAAKQGSDDDGRLVTSGRAAIDLLQAGLSFKGVSGDVHFSKTCLRSPSGIRMELDNIQMDAATGKLTAVTIGTVVVLDDARAGQQHTVTLHESPDVGSVLLWPDGTSFPHVRSYAPPTHHRRFSLTCLIRYVETKTLQVPDYGIQPDKRAIDSGTTHTLVILLAALGCTPMVFAVIAWLLIRRTRRLQAQVDGLEQVSPPPKRMSAGFRCRRRRTVVRCACNPCSLQGSMSKVLWSKSSTSFGATKRRAAG